MLDKKDSKCNIEGAIPKHFEEENRPYVVLFNVSDWSAKLSFPKEVPDLLIKNRCCTLRHKHALCTHIFSTCRRLRESRILLYLADLASCVRFRQPFDHTTDLPLTMTPSGREKSVTESKCHSNHIIYDIWKAIWEVSKLSLEPGCHCNQCHCKRGSL